MAGEDPGVGVITLLLDVAQRAASTVLGFFKGIGNAIVDIMKMLVFMSWRRQAMHQGPKLKHGKQSLKHLRRHEDRGAQLVSVEIGDQDAMKALDHELRALKIDYAITGNRTDGYTLHYKSVNEQDVLMAQARALEQLYGDPNQANQEQETLNDPNQRDERDQQGERREDRDQDREQTDQQDREEHQDDEQNRDEQEDRNDEAQDELEHQNEQERQNQQEQEQNRQQNEREQHEEPAPAPIPNEVGEKVDSPDDKAKHGKHTRQEAPDLAERMPDTPSQSQQDPKMQAQAKDAPQFEPLESLIAKARERAAAKNAGRSHAIDRTKDRVRAREVSFSH